MIIVQHNVVVTHYIASEKLYMLYKICVTFGDKTNSNYDCANKRAKIIFFIVNAILYHFYRDTIIISSRFYEDIYGIITLLSDIFFHHRDTINSVKSLNL